MTSRCAGVARMTRQDGQNRDALNFQGPPMTKDLIERLEAATGADRELDRDIAVWAMPDLADLPRHGDGWLHAEFGKVAPPDPYTASLDASLALVGEKLPGWMVAFAGPWRWADHTARGGQPIWCAEIDRCTEENGLGYREVNDLKHRAPTPALAVLIALCRALETK